MFVFNCDLCVLETERMCLNKFICIQQQDNSKYFTLIIKSFKQNLKAAVRPDWAGLNRQLTNERKTWSRSDAGPLQ